MESSQTEYQKEKIILKNENRLKELSNIIRLNMHIIGITEREERAKGVENSF